MSVSLQLAQCSSSTRQPVNKVFDRLKPSLWRLSFLNARIALEETPRVTYRNLRARRNDVLISMVAT